jgi:RimJ/RimL family protein N-acetyltransferase
MTSPGELAREHDLSLRRMRADEADLALILDWRRQPHVRAFWDNDDEPEITPDFVLANYAPMTDPSSDEVATIIELGETPIGYLQFYPWSGCPDEAREMQIPMDGDPFGLDIFMGDPRFAGRGFGSRAVDLACRYLFESRRATRVALLTAVENVGAQRAYEKAGFVRVCRALDVDVRGGERIASWLMVRERPR